MFSSPCSARENICGLVLPNSADAARLVAENRHVCPIVTTSESRFGVPSAGTVETSFHFEAQASRKRHRLPADQLYRNLRTKNELTHERGDDVKLTSRSLPERTGSCKPPPRTKRAMFAATTPSRLDPVRRRKRYLTRLSERKYAATGPSRKYTQRLRVGSSFTV
jgi:hypothetical protein